MKIDLSKKFTNYFEPFLGNPLSKFRTVKFIVLHHVAADSADHAIEQFKQHQVSAHYLVDESGKIFQLVDENDIAFHAGVSFWRGCDGLNKSSIGIEFINSDPFGKKFSESQLISAVELTKYLMAKYGVEDRNLVGHSDIAYDKESGFLNRKQDPSHLFDWQFLAQNGVGIRRENVVKENQKAVFKFQDRHQIIFEMKQNLKNFGYKINNLNDVFDEELKAVMLVFNRRFLGLESDEIKGKIIAEFHNF